MVTPVQQTLLDEISALIEQSKRAIYAQVNSVTVMLFWKIGQRVNNEILKNKRADYGKQIVVSLSRQLSWSHFLALIPLKSGEAKMFYARETITGGLGVRELRGIR